MITRDRDYSIDHISGEHRRALIEFLSAFKSRAEAVRALVEAAVVLALYDGGESNGGEGPPPELHPDTDFFTEDWRQFFNWALGELVHANDKWLG